MIPQTTKVMTTTLKNWARGLHFNSSRVFGDRPSGFEAQGCILTRSWVIEFTNKQTDRQTDRQTTCFTFADPLASLIAQPIILELYVCFQDVFRLWLRLAKSKFHYVADDILVLKREAVCQCSLELSCWQTPFSYPPPIHIFTKRHAIRLFTTDPDPKNRLTKSSLNE